MDPEPPARAAIQAMKDNDLATEPPNHPNDVIFWLVAETPNGYGFKFRPEAETLMEGVRTVWKSWIDSLFAGRVRYMPLHYDYDNQPTNGLHVSDI